MFTAYGLLFLSFNQEIRIIYAKRIFFSPQFKLKYTFGNISMNYSNFSIFWREPVVCDEKNMSELFVVISRFLSLFGCFDHIFRMKLKFEVLMISSFDIKILLCKQKPNHINATVIWYVIVCKIAAGWLLLLIFVLHLPFEISNWAYKSTISYKKRWI